MEGGAESEKGNGIPADEVAFARCGAEGADLAKFSSSS